MTLGDPEAGYLKVDDSGLKTPNNYRRYLSHNELASFVSPQEDLIGASLFEVRRGQESRRLSREEFQSELEILGKKAGIE